MKAQVRRLYQDKGYPNDWIEKRVRGIAVRDTLTAEWQKQRIQDQKIFHPDRKKIFVC